MTNPAQPIPPPHMVPQPQPQRRDPRTIRQALTGAGVLGILVWLAWSIAAQLASGTVSGNSGTIVGLHGWCGQNAGALTTAGAERACSLIGDGYLLAAVVFWLSIAAFVAVVAMLVAAAAPWKAVR